MSVSSLFSTQNPFDPMENNNANSLWGPTERSSVNKTATEPQEPNHTGRSAIIKKKPRNRHQHQLFVDNLIHALSLQQFKTKGNSCSIDVWLHYLEVFNKSIQHLSQRGSSPKSAIHYYRWTVNVFLLFFAVTFNQIQTHWSVEEMVARAIIEDLGKGFSLHQNMQATPHEVMLVLITIFYASCNSFQAEYRTRFKIALGELSELGKMRHQAKSLISNATAEINHIQWKAPRCNLNVITFFLSCIGILAVVYMAPYVSVFLSC
jgi:hypothetical protein